ncbi:MAG: response regulator transcription factor [Lentimicrobiaceae bacterium]|nr:response regulator transcription factor [Lentimicrobiaceae bacterium]
MEQEINVLLAEDDKNLGIILQAYLNAKGFPTTLCINGAEALKLFKHGDYNFCIFDVMMPEMDGFTLAAEVRKIDPKVPLLFLTAKTMQNDKLHGFELGADDYITKPFNMEELLMRIKAILRRSAEDIVRQTIFEIGSFTFDYNSYTLTHNGKENKLTFKESELLRLLCENLNQVLNRSVALNKIWLGESYFNARTMDVYITKLRKYFKEDPNVELLNVHGIGFKLIVKT